MRFKPAKEGWVQGRGTISCADVSPALLARKRGKVAGSI